MRALNGFPILAVVAAAAMVTMISMGLRAAIPLFQVPMLADVEFGRTDYGFALGVQQLAWGLFAPFFGFVADRFGPAKVIVFGSIVYAAGLASMAVSLDAYSFTMTAGLLVGMGQAGAGQAIAMGAVARLVPEERRTWALGIATMGGSAGIVVTIPIAQYVLNQFGWSDGYVVLALLPLLLIMVAYVLAGKSQGPTIGAVAEMTARQAIRCAFGHRSFVLLVTGFFVCGYHVAFIGTHMPAYVSDIGLSAETGAAALTLMGAVNILGAYLAGVLGSRMHRAKLLSYIYIGRAITIAWLMIGPPEDWSIYIFSIAMGLFWLSVVPIPASLVASMFGTQYMSMLFGFVFVGHQVGSFTGVYLGGYLFDVLGSYDIVWWGGAALGLVAAAIHWPISDKPAPVLAMAR